MKEPKVGEDIYIRGAMYLSHGKDDYCGGLAKVKSVTSGISAGKPTPFVSVEEIPGRSWNWEILSQDQEKLKEQYGERRAHPDPDDREQFNRWD